MSRIGKVGWGDQEGLGGQGLDWGFIPSVRGALEVLKQRRGTKT